MQNRIIKFRAWDSQEKEMIEPAQIWGDPRQEVLISLCGETIYFYEASNGHYCPSTIEAKEKSYLALMQFTGLKDKNGKDIYDADLVKRRVWLVEGKDYMDYTCVIRWNGWCYGLCVADKQLWGLDPITAKECEIIGNIYENDKEK